MARLLQKGSVKFRKITGLVPTQDDLFTLNVVDGEGSAPSYQWELFRIDVLLAPQVTCRIT